MVRSVALLVDGQRAPHQRLGLRQPVRGLEQLRQVVETGRRGMITAELFSSMASARRSSGSASAKSAALCKLAAALFITTGSSGRSCKQR